MSGLGGQSLPSSASAMRPLLSRNRQRARQWSSSGSLTVPKHCASLPGSTACALRLNFDPTAARSVGPASLRRRERSAQRGPLFRWIVPIASGWPSHKPGTSKGLSCFDRFPRRQYWPASAGHLFAGDGNLPVQPGCRSKVLQSTQ
jgi:hypothetical protein